MVATKNLNMIVVSEHYSHKESQHCSGIRTLQPHRILTLFWYSNIMLVSGHWSRSFCLAAPNGGGKMSAKLDELTGKASKFVWCRRVRAPWCFTLTSGLQQTSYIRALLALVAVKGLWSRYNERCQQLTLIHNVDEIVLTPSLSDKSYFNSSNSMEFIFLLKDYEKSCVPIINCTC